MQNGRSQLNHVAVRIFDVRERSSWAVLAAPNQLAPSTFHGGDGRVKVGGVRQAKPEMGDTTVYASEMRLFAIFVEGNQILTASAC